MKKYLPNQEDSREQLFRAKFGLGPQPDYPPVPRPGFDPRAFTPAVPGVASTPEIPVREKK